MKCVATATALLLCGLVGGSFAEEPHTLPTAMLPAPHGTINLELDIRVDGRSPKAAWNEFLHHFFDFFDRDSDGLLSEAECARLPRLPIPEKKELIFAFSVLDRDSDGGVSRSELIEFCSERGFSHVVIRRERPSIGDVNLASVFQQWFDGNRDGTIAADELRRVAHTMSRYDLDEDGAVSFEELLGSSVADLSQIKSLSQTARAAEGLSSPSARSVRLEINLDGTQPSVIASVDTTPVMTAMSSSGPLSRFAGPKNTWMLTLDTRRQFPNVRSAGDFLTAQFQNVLADRTELTLQQIREDSSLSGLTELARMADRNGNQRLSLAELKSYSDLVAGALRSQIWITMSDHSGNLFSALDENADGRLSFVELSNVGQVLGSHETMQTLPRQFQIAFGAAPVRSWGGMLVPSLPKPTPTPAKQQASGPKWFLALDRNRDGVISGREFVGPPEAFHRLDTDGDGMLNLDEAARSAAR